MRVATTDLALALRAALAAVADPSRAPGMQAYMKLAMPCLGVAAVPMRKAIGWALRQYAWTDPVEVRRYVAAHAGRLSGLSRREALKNVGATA